MAMTMLRLNDVGPRGWKRTWVGEGGGGWGWGWGADVGGGGSA